MFAPLYENGWIIILYVQLNALSWRPNKGIYWSALQASFKFDLRDSNWSNVQIFDQLFFCYCHSSMAISDTLSPSSLSHPFACPTFSSSSSSSCPRCAWLLLFDLCPRLQVGGAGVQSWPITIRASPSVTRPLWGWIMSRLPTAVSPVSGNLPNMDQWELRTERVGRGDEERHTRRGKARRA